MHHDEVLVSHVAKLFGLICKIKTIIFFMVKEFEHSIYEVIS